MRGHPRLDPGIVAHIVAAEAEARKNIARAPCTATSLDIEQARAYHEAITQLRDIIDAQPQGPRHLAWKWQQLSGIAADLDRETVKLLQRAGVVQ